MKYAAAVNPHNINSAYAREYVSLSPKIVASSLHTETFNLNSPKTLATKGLVLSKSTVDNSSLLTRGMSNSNPFMMTTKAKTSGTLKGYTPTLMLVDNNTPSQKRAESQTISAQLPRKTEKKSNSATKLKSDSYRPMTSTPKNLGGSSRAADSVRLNNDANNSAQYRWKKLEISTEFNNNNAKNIQLTKSQTTKHTEVDENGLSKSAVPVQQSVQLVQKSLQAKSMNTAGFGSPNNQEKGTVEIKFDSKFRTNRPQSSSSSTKNRDRSLPNDTAAKENVKINNFFASELGNKTPQKNVRKTPNSAKKSGNTVVHSDADLSQSTIAMKKLSNSTHFDLRTNWQASGNESVRKDKRPLSAKKPTRDNSKDDLEKQVVKADKGAAQKASLNAFVTKVNKGDVFGSIKKYSEKRDNSARKHQQKPYLNLEDNKGKPVRAMDIDMRASRTTTNTDSKTFAVSLARPAVAVPTQTVPPKNSKNTKSNGSSVKELVRSPTNESVVKLNRPGPEREPFIYYMTNLVRSHKWDGEADYFVQIYREHFIQSYQALSFCRNLKAFDTSVINQKKVNLPRRESHKDKKTVVFDMDETLIHCNESLDMPADVILPIVFPNGEIVEAGINIRPYAVEILKELSQYYEVVVFTASHSCYANVVLDYLDPEGEYIHHRLFRESCVVTDEGVHIKDLRVIGNRNMHDLILIDNAAYSFGFQIENGIPIIPFYDNKADQELRRLIPYLKFLSSVKDVRDINKQTFKMHQYSDHDSIESALERLILQE